MLWRNKKKNRQKAESIIITQRGNTVVRVTEALEKRKKKKKL